MRKRATRPSVTCPFGIEQACPTTHVCDKLPRTNACFFGPAIVHSDAFCNAVLHAMELKRIAVLVAWLQACSEDTH